MVYACLLIMLCFSESSYFDFKCRAVTNEKASVEKGSNISLKDYKERAISWSRGIVEAISIFYIFLFLAFEF